MLRYSQWAHYLYRRWAATSYSANITELNHSGVHGTANLLLDNDLLTVSLTAFGLEPNQTHVQHIHGLLDSNNVPLDSMSPTIAQDTDGDGFVELAEGLTTYGPIWLQLTNPPDDTVNDFPTAPNGQINYSQTFDLSSQITVRHRVYVGTITPAIPARNCAAWHDRGQCGCRYNWGS